MSEIRPASEPENRSAFVASLEDVEVRESGNGEEFTLTGHAAVFDKWSEELATFAGTFREKIAPGAFTKVLKSKPDVRLLFNHDGMTLARTKSGTLELSEDDEGLRVWARLSPDQQIARDLRAAMKRGDVDQMSFAFTIAEDEWHEDHDTEEVERTVLQVRELFDVSVVSFPAYPDTEAVMREVRSAAEAGKIHPKYDQVAGPLVTAANVNGVDITNAFTVAKFDPASLRGHVAQPETDAAGTPSDGDAPADPVEPVADPLAELKARTSEAAARGRESYLQILKEINS